MWSDNEAQVDLLRFGYLAGAIKRLVAQRTLLPTTIGVFGDWGSGKSTVLKMAQTQIEQVPGTLCVTFNGWLFEGYEDAKTALMGTILDAIQDRATDTTTITEQGQALLSKLFKRVDWLRLATMAGRYMLPTLLGLPHVSLLQMGVDAGRFIASAPGKMASTAEHLDAEQARQVFEAAPEGQENIRRNIRDFRSDFGDLLVAAQIETLVVFIDDLDRCLPDNIIETLEAIKLFLFVPGTAFVLGADERLVEYAVRQRFPELPGTETAVGRDYLEKLIQIPLRLPPLSAAELESYLGLLFASRDLTPEAFTSVCEFVTQAKIDDPARSIFTLQAARDLFKSTSLPNELETDLDLVTQIGSILAPGLGGNPRRAKRFLNTLMLRLDLSAERGLELQRKTLAKLMLLEYLKPEFFRQLAHLQAHQQGKPRELAIIERQVRTAEVTLVESPGGTSTGSARDGLRVPGPFESSASNDKLDKGDGLQGALGSAARSTTQRSPAPSAPVPPPPTTTVLGSSQGSEPVTEEMAQTIQTWMADGWMQSWLLTAPTLATIDLRPYFYIAHEHVGTIDGAHLRLSPMAAEVLRRLLDTGEVTQGIGLSRVPGLNSADATAVFDSLAQQVRQAEKLEPRSPPFSMIFSFVEKRPEFLPQLISLLGALPETKLPAATTTLLLARAKDTESSAPARVVVERWSRSTNIMLKRAALVMLNRSS